MSAQVVTIGFEEVVRLVGPRALREAGRYRLDGACPEDVVQEALIQYFRLAPECPDADAAWRWMRKAVRHIALNKGRRLVRRTAEPVPDRPVEDPDRVLWTSAFERLAESDRATLAAAATRGTRGWPPVLRKQLERARARLEAELAAAALVAGERLRRLVAMAPEAICAAVVVSSSVAGLPSATEGRAVSVTAAAPVRLAPRPPAPGAAAPREEAADTVSPDRSDARADPPSNGSDRERRVIAAVEGPTGPADVATRPGGGQAVAVCAASGELLDQTCVYWPDLRPLVPRP